jgi:hypothetical protein
MTVTYASTETVEGLHLPASLIHHSRARFILNLLPLMQNATGVRRVISVLCGTKEGPINLSDLQLRMVKTGDLIKQRGHGASIITLVHAHFAELAPTVSFIHDFPGFVKTGIARDTAGLLSVALKLIGVIFAFRYIPELESGERHLYLATSARYQASKGEEQGIALSEGVVTARGIDGRPGSGVYSTDQANESASPQIEQFIQRLKKDEMVAKLWKITEDDYRHIAEQSLKNEAREATT